MTFVWDPAMCRANLNKHGVDFADAVAVLEDPLAPSRPDADVRGEARFVVLGVDALGRHLVVAFTERGPDTRLISARLASKKERKSHEG
jgi:uncharacterized protein